MGNTGYGLRQGYSRYPGQDPACSSGGCSASYSGYPAPPAGTGMGCGTGGCQDTPRDTVGTGGSAGSATASIKFEDMIV